MSSAILFYLFWNALALTLNVQHAHTFWYLWMMPTLLVAYLIVKSLGTRALVRSRVVGSAHVADRGGHVEIVGASLDK